MNFVDRHTPITAANLAPRTQRSDGWVLAYAAVALFAILLTVYFASDAPGMTDEQIAVAAVWQ
jgi:hypothetical protein